MLTLFHGDKGGVGKSFACQVYLDSLLANWNADRVIVVESDTRNPDVARTFQSHMRVEKIDLKVHDGWMALVDLLADDNNAEVVVSLPSGIGHYLEEEAEYLVPVLEDLGHELRVYWAINRLKDSIILLKEFLHSPLSSLASEMVVIKNGFFGEEKKFTRWDESKTRKEFLSRKGAKEVFLPELHDRVVDAVVGPYSFCTGLRYSERAELDRWIQVAHQVVAGKREN